MSVLPTANPCVFHESISLEVESSFITNIFVAPVLNSHQAKYQMLALFAYEMAFVKFSTRCCKRENEEELSHSLQYGIEDEERGSWGQSKVKVWGEGGVFG
jgi:hypothetical protein